MRIIYSAIVVITVLFTIQFANAQLLTGRLPEAPVVTAAQIQSLQTDPNKQNRFVIVDVRAKSETDVSIIPGAITQTEFERFKSTKAKQYWSTARSDTEVASTQKN